MLRIAIETIAYLVFGAAAFVSAALLASVVLFAASLRSARPVFLARLNSIALLLAFVYLWGALGNLFWVCFLAPHLYVMADPIVHFLPLVPFGSWLLDELCGGHLFPGVSLYSVQALWVLTAAAVWALALASYRAVRPTSMRALANPSLQRTRCARR